MTKLSKLAKGNQTIKKSSVCEIRFFVRKCFVKDFDGQYYKLSISIGHNNVATVYNIGKIKKDNIPQGNVISSIGSKADMLSANSMSNSAEKSNSKNEKNSFALDSDGKNLTEEQTEYFKNSKVRDEDGKLLVVYHGTSEKFTVFDCARGWTNMEKRLKSSWDCCGAWRATS